jgi:AcrR family transcriptional regulator
MPGRNEHRTQTYELLGQTAVALFAEHGFDSVTVDDVATSAGVSRRTVFRYFPSKEDLVLVHPQRWIDVFDSTVTDNPGESPVERVRLGALAVADLVDADPAGVRQALEVAATHPSLVAGVASANQRLANRIADELSSGSRAAAKDRFRARIVAGAVVGVFDTAIAEWIRLGNRRLRPIVQKGLEVVEPLLVA